MRLARRLNVRLCCSALRPPLVRHSSWWAHVPQGPEDPILGITVAFNNDTDPNKINLGVGAYRDDEGKPHILNCVKQATTRILNDPTENHEYLPIGGSPKLTQAAVKLVLGDDSLHIKDKRYVTIQSLSGTGALSVCAHFLNRFYKENQVVYLPNPTWANHIPLFKDAGLQVQTYRYYDNKANKLDFNGLKSDISNAPKGSIILLHACAHNPTGQDPSQAQWDELIPIFKEKNHFPLFDCAYQGFASGDVERDVWAIRRFVGQGLNVAICQSFAKNFGLYGQRVGALTLLTDSAKEAEAVDSQLKIWVRPQYSNPPKFGASIVSTILTDPELRKLWYGEVKEMADRIIRMRQLLVSGLKAAGSSRDWTHITEQIGMFCYSGLTASEVERLARDYHIYMTKNGRISMAGVTSKNVSTLAQAMHEVTK